MSVHQYWFDFEADYFESAEDHMEHLFIFKL